LDKKGIAVSYVTVVKILEANGHSNQGNRKMLWAGEPNPNMNEQFEYINSNARAYIDKGEPVISADARKKENMGNFKNCGREYRLKKTRERF
jgi:hypothetical protein